MTGMKILLDEVANEAKVYQVLASAKAGARRRRRVRRALVAGSACVAVVGLTTSLYVAMARDETGVGSAPAASTEPSPSPTEAGPAFPTSCVAQQLPTPDGYPPMAVVTGADPTGRFVLGRAYPGDARPRILIWDNGEVTAVSMPGDDPQLVSVNSSGLAVGFTHMPNDRFRAYVYHDGVMTTLADDAQAFYVNEAGAILGQLWSGTTRQPVLWPSASAQPVPLQLPADMPSAVVVQIADDGSVIGYVGSEEDLTARRPVLWHQDGSRVDLQWPSLPGPDGQPVRSYLLRAGRGDWAIVEVYAEQAPRPALYVWNVRTDQTRSLAQAADLVGTAAWSVVRSHEHPDASLVSDQRSLTLPRLPGVDYTGDPVRITVQVSGISEDGHVIAAQLTRPATIGYDNILPLVWRCA